MRSRLLFLALFLKIFLICTGTSRAAANLELYEILGVSPTASRFEIYQAYTRLSNKYHDVYGRPLAGAPAMPFEKVYEAYKVLDNPESRERYNRTGIAQILTEPLNIERPEVRDSQRLRAAEALKAELRKVAQGKLDESQIQELGKRMAYSPNLQSFAKTFPAALRYAVAEEGLKLPFGDAYRLSVELCDHPQAELRFSQYQRAMHYALSTFGTRPTQIPGPAHLAFALKAAGSPHFENLMHLHSFAKRNLLALGFPHDLASEAATAALENPDPSLGVKAYNKAFTWMKAFVTTDVREAHRLALGSLRNSPSATYCGALSAFGR